MNLNILTRAILETSPTYEQMDSVEDYGYYMGGFHDKWIWHKDKINSATAGEIIKLARNLNLIHE